MGSLGRWLELPWRISKLRRRVVAQRGTIIAQRAEINRLKTELVKVLRDQRNADILATRRLRNKMLAEKVVAAKVAQLNDENDILSARVNELQQ